MKSGDTIVVYEDPLTKEKPEGKAVLLRKNGTVGPEMERWMVRFEDDGFEAERFIAVD